MRDGLGSGACGEPEWERRAKGWEDASRAGVTEGNRTNNGEEETPRTVALNEAEMLLPPPQARTPSCEVSTGCCVVGVTWFKVLSGQVPRDTFGAGEGVGI